MVNKKLVFTKSPNYSPMTTWNDKTSKTMTFIPDSQYPQIPTQLFSFIPESNNWLKCPNIAVVVLTGKL